MSSVDVIIPCYRYGHFLRQCVESVLCQSGVDVRALIIDDASPDNTADVATELAKEDPRVTFIHHDQNMGHIATYNEGIEWVSAKYMLLLSADDYLLPGALARSADLMDTHPEVGFTFGKAAVLNSRNSEEYIRTIVQDSDAAEWRILEGSQFIELSGAKCIVKTPTAVVRTELQKALGGYRPELPHAGDMEMWLRLAAHASVGIVEAYQAIYREHDSNMSLGYSGTNWLPDLQQRKLALDYFFETCAHILTNAEQLRARSFLSLGCQAISRASDAYNKGELELSRRYSEYAVLVYPEVRKTLPWIQFGLKRCIGLQLCHVLLPIAASVRRLIYSVKRSMRGA